jgi:hypothetical protein
LVKLFKQLPPRVDFLQTTFTLLLKGGKHACVIMHSKFVERWLMPFRVRRGLNLVATECPSLLLNFFEWYPGLIFAGGHRFSALFMSLHAE